MHLILAVILACLLVLIFTICLPRGRITARSRRKLLISLGSGGHTTEMLLLLRTIDVAEFRRIYYVSSGDTLSVRHARDFESHVIAQGAGLHEDTVTTRPDEAAIIRIIPRARRVGQSWSSTILTTLRSLMSAVWWVYKDQPDMLICNGPGTCVTLACASYFFRILKVKHCRIIFVESFARVKRLSLSGKILIHFVDRFLVLWPELAEQHSKAEYAGMLI